MSAGKTAGRPDLAARCGLADADREARIAEVLARVAEAELEVVRLSFVDQHGLLRGKTLMAGELEAAFRDGIAITSTLLLKDTSHKTVFPVWGADAGFGAGVLTGAGNVMMLPDPASFRILPWSPHSGWLLCDLYDGEGAPVALSTRQLLARALSALAARGLEIVFGLEVEFYVFRLDNPRLAPEDAGPPETPPDHSLLTHGFQYLTEDRYDRLEPVFDLVRRNAVGLGLPVRSFETEFGPSQCEVTFHPAAGAAHADTMVLFRSMVKQVCRREGLHATFMCRPRLEPALASGWHLHQSLRGREDGENRMMPAAGEALSQTGRHWLAGLLANAPAACAFATPTVNGYRRYQPFALAPDRIQWGIDNKGAMLRVLAAPDDPASRIENRIGEPAANPYLYMASQIVSGLDGLERGAEPPPPVESPYEADAPALPANLGEAIAALADSAVFRAGLGAAFVDYFVHLKTAEWRRYLGTISEWEQREYFSLF